MVILFSIILIFPRHSDSIWKPIFR
jgi:hypothetical protein